MTLANKTTVFNVLHLLRIFVFACAFTLIHGNIIPVEATGISKGFLTEDSIERGMVVSFADDSAEKVTKGTLSNESKIAGVTVSSTQSAIALSSPTSDIQVTSEGSVQVYVSDLEGKIKKGDYIGLSNIKGVGVKAGEVNRYVLGTVLEDVDFNSSQASSMDAMGANNENIESKIALASVMVNIRGNPMGDEAEKPFIVVMGENLVGKPVSLSRIIVSSLVVVIVFLIAGVLLLASIRGSFISIGRNPLAVKSIHGGLLRVSVTSGLILLAGLGVAYAILLI